MARHGSWDDDGSSLSESLLQFVHGDDEFDDTPAPRPVTQALALTPATRERTPHKPKDNSDLDELTFYYSPEEPGVRGEVRVGLDRSFDRYDEEDDQDQSDDVVDPVGHRRTFFCFSLWRPGVCLGKS